VVAFAEAGFEASGIEIDETWCALGNLNCESRGFGRAIALGDFLDAPLEGRFDVITCNDVIEHVLAPRTAIERMASLLNPGGALFMMVPNAWSHEHVLKDGHFGQFGLNLLEHYAAREYYDLRCKAVYQRPYSCGEFHPLGWYREQLARAGLSSELHRTTSARLPSDEQVRDIVAGLDAARFAWDRKGLPEILVDQVEHLYLKYRHDLLDEHAAAQRDPELVAGFLETYIDSFWMLFGRRGG
jgi:SAM-dependent methyltransferase